MKLYCPLNYDFTIKDLEIRNNKISKCNKIINKKYQRIFGSFLKKNDIYYLFLTDGKDDFSNMDYKCKILTSKDGIEFKEEKEEIKLKAVCNNIVVSNINNEILIFGGRHCEKETQKKHNNLNCICKNNNYHDRIKPPFPLDKGMFYNNGKGTLPFINDNFHHPCYMNGIYFFNFNDFIEPKIISRKPIISGLDKGMVDNVFGATTFDSQNSLVFSKEDSQYYFFCRLNGPIKGKRFIQYSSSENLFDWKEFKSIEIKNFNPNKANFYSPNFFEYPDSDFYIGILTDFTNKSKFTLLLSEDLKSWKNKGSILDFGKGNVKTPGYENNICHGGLVTSSDKKEFYVYVYNVIDTFWYRYSIRKDGFKSLSSIGEEIGLIEFNEAINIENFIYVNYKTSKDGYIRLNFYSEDKLIFNRELVGDFVKKEIEIPKDFRNNKYIIKIEIYMSEFFSITI